MCLCVLRYVDKNIQISLSVRAPNWKQQVSRNIKMDKQTMIQSFKRRVFNTGNQLKINAARG